MNRFELELGDVIAKIPFGDYPLWMFVKPVGPKLGVYMRLDTGELMEGSCVLDATWCVMRGGAFVQGGT